MKTTARWITKRCPKCGKKAVITKESRARVNWRYRSKLCLNCNARGTTLEIPMEPGVKPMLEEIRIQGGYQTVISSVPLALVAEMKRAKPRARKAS